jgi:YegS/Rv2252/BmrU family lipid kinase
LAIQYPSDTTCQPIEPLNSSVTVIVNASSGAHGGGNLSEDLVNRFKAVGMEAEIRLTQSTEIVSEVRRALIGKPKTIVVGGGDGTLNAVASMLIRSDIALGILPLGTLNHFARDLDIPLDLEGAVHNIAHGHRRKVDLGVVNDRFFLNNSSLGLYPEAVAGRDALQQRLGRGKWLALISAAAAVFRRYPFLNVRIEVNGTELVRRTPFVFIGNNQYEMEGFSIGEREHLDGALLSMYVANRTGRLGLIRLAIRSLFKRLRQAKDFDMVSAEAIEVETRHERVQVAIDGELCVIRTPLSYRVLPAALSVIVPVPEITT